VANATTQLKKKGHIFFYDEVRQSWQAHRSARSHAAVQVTFFKDTLGGKGHVEMVVKLVRTPVSSWAAPQVRWPLSPITPLPHSESWRTASWCWFDTSSASMESVCG